MIVVSNASPLIALSNVGLLQVLEELFGGVYIPAGVWREVVNEGRERPGARDVTNAEWIKQREVQDTIAVYILQERLDQGESEAIVLALETGADVILLDDKRARKIAQGRGLNVIGTLGVLLRAKEIGYIDAVKPYLDKLVLSGFLVSPRLYAVVLKKAGE